ncbi:hypothetical protein ACJMK2_007134 [Sinanodonta woodiana]|uniref:Uncharacterized protein n=1 Tax=Sinanodonta woodiana TaxID=1069815 RepID=A0ABD3VKG5_SINWO
MLPLHYTSELYAAILPAPSAICCHHIIHLYGLYAAILPVPSAICCHHMGFMLPYCQPHQLYAATTWALCCHIASLISYMLPPHGLYAAILPAPSAICCHTAGLKSYVACHTSPS